MKHHITSLRPVRSLKQGLTLVALATATFMAGPTQAASHREAPFITTSPKVDATDFYMFMSYETGRTDYVTLIANYAPLQDAYGGPNYFALDPDALYEIHLDNNGDAKEDLTFQFRFKNTLKSITRRVGDKDVAIPLVQNGTISSVNDAKSNLRETYTVDVVRGERRTGTHTQLTGKNGATFDKPMDNIGTKTIPDYPGYAGKHVYEVTMPGCAMPAKVFVGQRKDPFAVNLGAIFDNVNAPLSVITDRKFIGAAPSTIDDKNVTTMAVEVHKSCLVASGETVLGGWTTASVRQARLLSAKPKSGHKTTDVNGGAWLQVSRLGQPLINEVVIGLPDKDKFNGSEPKNDGQFATYVTHPTLPGFLEDTLAIPGTAPKNLPRTDLVTVFLTGIPGVNQPKNVVGSEMLRLNTSIAAVAEAMQNRLGIMGSLRDGGTDFSGFPNGRRPKDDVVDVSISAMMGALCMANGEGTNTLGLGANCKPSNVPLGKTSLELHDAVDQAKIPLLAGFPYLFQPIPGAK